MTGPVVGHWKEQGGTISGVAKMWGRHKFLGVGIIFGGWMGWLHIRYPINTGRKISSSQSKIVHSLLLI